MNVQFETCAAREIDIKLLSDDHLRPDALSSPLSVSALATRLTSAWKQPRATNVLSSPIVATLPLVGARAHLAHSREPITGCARAEWAAAAVLPAASRFAGLWHAAAALLPQRPRAAAEAALPLCAMHIVRASPLDTTADASRCLQQLASLAIARPAGTTPIFSCMESQPDCLLSLLRLRCHAAPVARTHEDASRVARPTLMPIALSAARAKGCAARGAALYSPTAHQKYEPRD